MSKKLILDTDDSLWAEVTSFKIKQHLKTNNEAVIVLIREGLKHANQTT